MITVKKIEAQNFMSYERLDLCFDKRGTILVTGPNGSGKSAALVDALSWVLYGKTIRGIAGDDVVRFDSKGGCFVKVLLETSGRVVRVERYRKHSKMKNKVLVFVNDKDETKGTAKVTNKYIADLLGISWTTYAATAVFGQAQVVRFALATDSERKAILDEMFGMQQFAQARDLVKTDLRQAEREVSDLKIQLEYHEREVTKITHNLEQLHKDSASWRDSHEREVQEAKEKLLNLQAQLNSLPDPIPTDTLVERIEKTQAEYKRLEREVANTSAQDQSREVLRLERHKSDLTVQLARLRSSYDAKLEALQRDKTSLITEAERLANQYEQPTTVCPTCGVDIDAAVSKGLLQHNHIRQNIERDLTKILDSIDRLDSDIERHKTTHSSKIDEINKKLRAVTMQINDLQKKQRTEQSPTTALLVVRRELDKLEAELRQIERKNRDYDNKRVILARTIETQEDMIMRIELETDPYTHLIDDYEEALDNAEEALQKIRVTYEVTMANVAALSFWFDAFGPKGIRSLLLDQILPALNKRAREYATVLGQGRLRVAFDTETQTKTGDYRERFDLQVTMDGHRVAYESLSGGWRQRVDMIQLLAFRDVAAQYNQGFDFLVLDEPITYIDAAGVEQAVALVKTVSNTVGTVFICSHNESFAAYFPKRLQVISKDGASVLEDTCL